MNLEEKIRNVQDFPKEGIGFKDITTLICDGEGFKLAVDRMADYLREGRPNSWTGSKRFYIWYTSCLCPRSWFCSYQETGQATIRGRNY